MQKLCVVEIILLVVHSWGMCIYICIHMYISPNACIYRNTLDLLPKRLIMHANTGRRFTAMQLYITLNSPVVKKILSTGFKMQLTILLHIGELNSFVKEIDAKCSEIH